MLLKRLSLLLLISLTACHSIGPKQVQLDRNTYNQILRETDYQQMLTNIVYISYTEPASYLKITNVTASYSLTSNMGGSANWTQGSNGDTNLGIPPTPAQWAFGLSPGVSYSDSPTISYMPIDNLTFVTMLQTPVSFGNLTLLFNGGIDDMELYARMIINRLGPLDNASSLSSPLVVNVVKYRKFYEFLHIFVTLLRNESATISPIIYNGHIGLKYQFSTAVSNSTAAITMKKLLQIPLDSTDFVMVAQNIDTLTVDPSGKFVNQNANTNPKNLVYVQMRSVYGIMSFLSHAVEIPQEDRAKDLTQKILDSNGEYVDLQPLMNNLMTIYSSQLEPNNAFIKVYVKGHWFYIRASDIKSKATFTLLMRLMTIVSGTNLTQNQQGPILTLPVGAG